MQVPSGFDLSRRRRVIPVEGYDVWPQAVYRPSVGQSVYDVGGKKRKKWSDMTWEEIKRYADEEKKLLKTNLKEQMWNDFKDIVGSGLGYVGMGIGEAASGAAGALYGAAKNVYDFERGIYDKFWRAKQGLDELAVMDDYLRKHG